MDQGFSLGAIVPEPTDFHPTDIFTDRKYIYKIDWQLNVCKRSPLYWNMNEPSGYFALILPEPEFQQDQEQSLDSGEASFLDDVELVAPPEEKKKRRGLRKKR